MQILPASSSAAVSAVAHATGVDDLGFSRMMGQYLDEKPIEITPTFHDTYKQISAEAGLSDSNAHAAVSTEDDMFVSKAPYLKTNSEHGANEIRFTSTEVSAIAASLQQQGVDPAVVQEVMKLMGSPLGVTAPDMLKSMSDVIRKPARVTDADMVRAASLLQRLDHDGSMSEQALADLRSGKANQAWQKIIGSLSAMDPNSKIALDHNEVLSLGKSLGLSDKTLDVLHKAFGGNNRMMLNPQQTEQLLTSIQHELGERQAQMDKLAAAFEKALSPVAQSARMRITSEESAAARASRSTQHSAILIEDTVTRNGLANNSPKTNEPAQGAANRHDAANQPRTEGTAAMQRLESLLHSRDDDASHGESRRDGKDAGKQDKKGGWTELLDRVRYQEAGSTSQAGRMSDLLSSAALMSQTAQAAQAGLMQPNQAVQAAVQPQLPLHAAQVLKQVEQGMLTGMRDGSQKLELQLSPEHLGTLSVVLTVKNGEISALLRPERGETATLLNQQTDQLRFALEQQGLKVDKVEVQTQLQDGRNSMAWQGMDQHNASQEQQTRTDQDRMMRIGRLHRSGSDDLDQKMQEGWHGVKEPADLAGRGLHIIT